MGRHYRHLDLEERCRICAMRGLGHSLDEISVSLGRSKSTICRELKRNSGADGYQPDQADRIAWARKLRGHLFERHSQLRARVVARLGMGWTPEQISGRLRLEGSEHTLSPESIYRYVYSPHGRKDKLHRYLAQRKAKRGYRRRKGRTSQTDEAKQPIWLRPTKAHTRAEVGHWEGDCMHFRNQSDILLTLQDRKTRYWVMSKLTRKDADTTADTIRFRLEGLPEKPARLLLLIMAQSSPGIRGWSRKQDCVPSSVNRIRPGSAGRLKTGMAASGATFREKRTFKTGRTMTSKP